MKKLITLFSLLLSLKSFGFFNCNQYGYFNIQARCIVNPATATCVVNNYCGRPMYCEMQGQAVTRAGYFGNNWNQGTILPGGNMYITLNATNAYVDPLINARATTQCRF